MKRRPPFRDGTAAFISGDLAVKIANLLYSEAVEKE
jgi:hypothetical protein